MAPINNPKNTSGALTPKFVIGWILSILDDLVMKAPYNEKETKAAEPIANPFPIAAVQLPAASS